MPAENLAFAWARTYDADQLSAFIDDLWGAASGDDDLATLDAIEAAIARHRPPSPPCPLTARELEVLTELANGETKESAARNLGLSHETVRTRCTQIYSRLDARNVTQAVVTAALNGWLPGVRGPATPEELPLSPGRKWVRVHKQHAAKMRKKPGQTVPIGPYRSHNGARNAARCIRQGDYQPFQPAGAFAAEHVRSGGNWIVLARFIGEPDAQSTRNCAEREAS
ncbi:response regulator transcription factor [Streptomyces sp. 1222.5]|uniref:response regulator transcription factor n=1 Tax=Streptomyces sp. 1222.5 TaxID=1881026 RepID=UPI003D71F592